MLSALRLLTLFALVLSVAACDSSEPEEEEEVVVDPSFNVSSVPVQLADGTAGLQFIAIPTMDIELTSARIQNPVGQSETFNANNEVVLANQGIGLQDPNFAYTRVSGQWTFTFTGNREAGSGGRFTVSTTVPVGARVRN